ncbi:putative B-family DNA-polymerase catalytic subunit [Bacillus phage vB_BpuM-BpSp]|nr:putative B-family DNA-polymerase catalytic subunit [Bacillus phage vB_BpuM-BpSp]
MLFETYKEKLIEQLELLYKDKKIDKEKLDEFLNGLILEKYQPKSIIFEEKENKNEKDLLGVVDWFLKDKPIISGYGTFYKKQDEELMVLTPVIEMFINERKKNKDLKFKHLNDEDTSLRDLYDLMQLTYKLLNNSFFGATIESNSIFFQKDFGPSITYTGVVIITTAVSIFESFLSANFEFRNTHDIVKYINNIINEKYTINNYNLKNASKEDVLEFLFSKVTGEIKEDKVASLISTLDQHQLNKLYYKNNFYKFLDNEEILNILEKTINTDFLDANKPPKEVAEPVSNLWTILSEWVFYNYPNFYRFDQASKGKKKSVLLVDTDSNFILMDPFYKFVKEKFPDRVGNEIKDRLAVTNIGAFCLSELIKNTFMDLTSRMNVPMDQQHIISMKNEFFYKRIMITRNKKNYAGLLVSQEGKIYTNPKVDIKGLPIKKVTVNKNVRDSFVSILDDDILQSENINHGEIIGKFLRLQDDIKKSLENGETKYLMTGKANDIESYVNPYSIMSVRGALIWNALFPSKEIVFPTKVNVLKLKTKELKDLVGLVPDEAYKIIKQTIYDDPNLQSHGFTVIAFPKNQKTIPSWLIPVIDIDKMVSDHVKSGQILLESIDFKPLNISTDKFPTNVLNF